MIMVIIGPTGVGKTKLSIELAKHYNAEIISGDSVQIYKGLDIRSAKVTEEEKEGIIHHLIDIRDVNDEYSIYNYQKDVRECISDIRSRNKNIIIVGGTGLYIKSALYDYTLLEEDKLKNNFDDVSTEELFQRLKALDDNTKVDKHNRHRIIRALNYYDTFHKSISDNNNGNKLLYDAIFIGLTMEDRNTLYQRINDRVDIMLENGLLDEVKQFHSKKIYAKPLMNAIGYKELYKYLDGDITYDEAVNLIKRNSRRYAKRQYTFFNNQFDIKWFNVNIDNFDTTIKEVINYIDTEKKDYISRI